MAVFDGAMRCDDDRRSDVLLAPTHPLNGIDFVEYRRVPSPPSHVLDVTFLKPRPANLVAANFSIEGGVRIVDVRVTGIATDPATPLRVSVFVDREGDFSFYAVRVDHPAMDLRRCEARFSFKASCPTPFDCRTQIECEPAFLAEPALDYLAKDYQSFRRLLVDLIALRNPGWQERLPADLGMTIVELLAYTGDYLSYWQDAGPATESYLDTCLHRISAARHARLIDYRMHDGRNAWTFVHFIATAGTDGVVPAGAKLVTRIVRPLIGQTTPPRTVLPNTVDFDADPALASSTVFEATALVRVVDLHNTLTIHTWGDAECCLAVGATEAWLYAVRSLAGSESAVLPELQVGDFLLLEEVLSPVTGVAADRDPRRRQVVRLERVEITEDAAFTDAVPGGVLQPRVNPADPALPLQHVVWRVEDRLTFPLCLSARLDGAVIDSVSVARGNVAPADHGRTLLRDSDNGSVSLPEPGSGRWPLGTLALPVAPLTQQAMPDRAQYDSAGRLVVGRFDLTADPSEVGPAVVLKLHFEDGQAELWTPVPSLLDSGAFDQHFVAEVDDRGQAVLRFGDDQYGRRPEQVIRVEARWRVGNGSAGNLGSEALVHIVQRTATDPLDPANPTSSLLFADVAQVYQPLPARQGTDPQSIEEVRQLAPEAFRALQFRAVTAQDWQDVALRHSSVAGARATFRWTGSWYTVFVAIQPRDSDALRSLPGGGVELQPAFATMMHDYLAAFLLAGYELVVLAAVYVPLQIEITLCIKRGYFRGHVLAAVSRVLSNQTYGDGTRGFFHPLNLGFAQAVYLSRLYAALDGIDGLESATVTTFRRYWEIAHDELERGLIPMADMEIARLDNDPNFPEAGVLRLTAVGGL